MRGPSGNDLLWSVTVLIRCNRPSVLIVQFSATVVLGWPINFGKIQHQLSQLKEEMANVLGRCNLECAHPRSSVEALTPQKVKRPKGPARPSKRARA